MRAHDQTSRLMRRRIRPGIVVFVAALAATSGAARGQQAPQPEPVLTQLRDPIDLAAGRVRVWESGGARWVHLSGQAAILQGVEGVRADEAVVRVSVSPEPTGNVYRLDVYAEGVKTARAEVADVRRFVRTTLETDVEVRLKPYEEHGLVRLGGQPVQLPILARSGFAQAVNPPADEKLARAGGRPRPARPPVAIPAATTLPPANATPNVVALPDFEPTPPSTPGPTKRTPKVDPTVVPTQYPAQLGGTDDPAGVSNMELPPAVEGADDDPTTDQSPRPSQTPALGPLDVGIEPLPGPDGAPAPPIRGDAPARRAAPPVIAPILPGSQRVTRIYPRNGGPNFRVIKLQNRQDEGLEVFLIVGGVNVVIESPKVTGPKTGLSRFGILDISADQVILWRRVGVDGKSFATGPNGEQLDDPGQPLELYLEGNVIVKQDEQKVAGNGDQKTYIAKQAYYDVLSERFIGVDAELEMFAPGLIAPARVTSPKIEQFRPFVAGPDGKGAFGLAEIRADKTMSTGSRFPRPGYQFKSRSIDIYRILGAEVEPNSGKRVGRPGDPNEPQDLTWKIDARQNVFWMGSVPVFYWPRFVAEADDLEPPLRQFTFRTNNYFGQQLLTDWNGFRLFNIKKPLYVDIWNIDVDYLSARTKKFPALGSSIGWFGRDLINDLSDPYGRQRGKAPTFTSDYFGYFDVWGLRDYGRDILGAGPAVITNNIAAGNAGYQRGGGGPKGGVPPFQDFRGRTIFRHMQRFLPDDDEHLFEDLRLQVEVAYTSDRYFLEEYYKRLFDVGTDQETALFLIRQKENWAYTIWGEANLQGWYTDTQWLPRLDYYRLGDSLVGDRLSYFQHSGVDYANTHTANEVNNPHLFAFLPYDPISNTSGVFRSFRGYTNHELDMPLNFDNILRVVPYVQGQAVGWDNQINGRALGRIWGAAGARADVMAYKTYPWVQSELLNVHGFNHKIDFVGDFRSAYSNQHLDSIGVQDDLDDNTYESTRRYFAMTNYAGGLLPQQYDPRHLILRRALSPITGPTDIQNSITTLKLGVHQRLQTKRGPEGKRRIIDYMTLDLDTTYFPNASRDNFGKPFGQNTYNWQWFLGDRTSIISTGWFEFWNITGNPIYHTNTARHNDPFGLNVITTGFNVTRPPRGNIFVGYTVINTGPINTSALNLATSYWLSPKWYGTYTTMYDFGNGILLSALFSLTRIGADYLTTVGLTVDPQRQSYMFAVQVAPRLSPTVKLGNGVGMNNFDARYAPTD